MKTLICSFRASREMFIGAKNVLNKNYSEKRNTVHTVCLLHYFHEYCSLLPPSSWSKSKPGKQEIVVLLIVTA
jgi:hypothetical protein